MKQKLLLFAFLLVAFAIPSSLFAESITKEQAKKIAIDFLKSNSTLTNVSQLNLVYDGADKVKSGDNTTPALYIYDNPNGKGFVIVAGDDIAYPVLGYSFENDFPLSNLPANIKKWIEGLEKRINYGRSKGYESNPVYSTKASIGSIVTKMTTAKWNQDHPYNLLAPSYGGAQCYTGCTITATAIIMKYHQYPESGPSYYTDRYHIFVPSITLGHKYNWNNMLDSYSNVQYTQEQANSVAQLMAEIGTAVQADYGTDGTGASTDAVVTSLIKYYNYDKSALNHMREYYNTSDWIEMIKAELNNNRPVLYSGFNEEAGHAFVLDGYTTENYFSINWGWGGYCDGYFMLDALYPSGSGIGGNNDHYNFNQGCITNLKPNAGGDWVEKLGIAGKGFMCSASKIESNKPYQIILDQLFNNGNCLFVGNIMCALTDKNGNIKEELANFYIPQETNLMPGWGWDDFSFEITIRSNIEEGDRLRMFYKTEKLNNWVLIKGGEECKWELILRDLAPIDKVSSLSYNKTTKTLVINIDQGITVNLFDSNNNNLSSKCKVEDKKVTVNTSDLPSDTYTIKLSRNTDVVELKVKLN